MRAATAAVPQAEPPAAPSALTLAPAPTPLAGHRRHRHPDPLHPAPGPRPAGRPRQRSRAPGRAHPARPGAGPPLAPANGSARLRGNVHRAAECKHGPAALALHRPAPAAGRGRGGSSRPPLLSAGTRSPAPRAAASCPLPASGPPATPRFSLCHQPPDPPTPRCCGTLTSPVTSGGVSPLPVTPLSLRFCSVFNHREIHPSRKRASPKRSLRGLPWTALSRAHRHPSGSRQVLGQQYTLLPPPPLQTVLKLTRSARHTRHSLVTRLKVCMEFSPYPKKRRKIHPAPK